MAPADLSLAKMAPLISESISPLPTGGQALEMAPQRETDAAPRHDLLMLQTKCLQAWASDMARK